MQNTVITSPARTSLLSFHVHSRESVEIVRTDWKGGQPVTFTERWLPEPEAANYRASLIHKGWSESFGDC